MILGSQSRDVAVTTSLGSKLFVGQEEEAQPELLKKVEFPTAQEEELFPMRVSSRAGLFPEQQFPPLEVCKAWMDQMLSNRSGPPELTLLGQGDMAEFSQIFLSSKKKKKKIPVPKSETHLSVLT